MDNEKKTPADITLNVKDNSTPFSFFKQKELIKMGERTVKGNLKNLEIFFGPRVSPVGKSLVREAEGEVNGKG